jgi:hypothetical protein
MRGDVWIQWRNGKRVLCIDAGRGKIRERVIGTIKIKKGVKNEN